MSRHHIHNVFAAALLIPCSVGVYTLHDYVYGSQEIRTRRPGVDRWHCHFHHTHHLQNISWHHLHTAHGCGQGAHNGGDNVQSTYGEQQLLKKSRRGRVNKGGETIVLEMRERVCEQMTKESRRRGNLIQGMFRYRGFNQQTGQRWKMPWVCSSLNSDI